MTKFVVEVYLGRVDIGVYRSFRCVSCVPRILLNSSPVNEVEDCEIERGTEI